MVRKKMGVYDQIPSGLAISKHEASNGVRWHSSQINEGMHQWDLRLGARETLELPPLFKLSH
jgi:hypothetical protein